MHKVSFWAVAFLLFCAPFAYGHGVTYGIFEEHAVAVRFGYAGGEPMSYAEVKVFGPQSSADLEFQNGRTDARGVFAFVPDRPGLWKVEAWDNQGHKGNTEVVVEQDDVSLKAGSRAQDLGGSPAIVKILLALSFIANVALVVATVNRAKRT